MLAHQCIKATQVCLRQSQGSNRSIVRVFFCVYRSKMNWSNHPFFTKSRDLHLVYLMEAYQADFTLSMNGMTIQVFGIARMAMKTGSLLKMVQ